MTPEECAHIHAAAFAEQGRAWDVNEISALLDSNYVFLCAQQMAFAMGRVIEDEAELLSIATHPDHHRQGLGRKCLNDFETAARNKGATQTHLEVAADNTAAIQLYLNHGYEQTAIRKSYYTRDNETVDALVMSKRLD